MLSHACQFPFEIIREFMNQPTDEPMINQIQSRYQEDDSEEKKLHKKLHNAYIEMVHALMGVVQIKKAEKQRRAQERALAKVTAAGATIKSQWSPNNIYNQLCADAAVAISPALSSDAFIGSIAENLVNSLFVKYDHDGKYSTSRSRPSLHVYMHVLYIWIIASMSKDAKTKAANTEMKRRMMDPCGSEEERVVAVKMVTMTATTHVCATIICIR